MIKHLSAALLLSTLSFSAMAQDVRQHIEKAAKDPQRKENAAKADALLYDRKVVTDSATQARSEAAPAKKKKKKNCGPKNRRS